MGLKKEVENLWSPICFGLQCLVVPTSMTNGRGSWHSKYLESQMLSTSGL